MNATLADLRRDHETIDILARHLAEQVERETSPAELSTTLEHLLRTVAEHLAREDAAIYTLALAAQPGLSREAADQVREDFERLKADWRDYLVMWQAEAIAADRAGFTRATRAMLPRLRDRVRLESKLLVAVALQAESGTRAPGQSDSEPD